MKRTATRMHTFFDPRFDKKISILDETSCFIDIIVHRISIASGRGSGSSTLGRMLTGNCHSGGFVAASTSTGRGNNTVGLSQGGSNENQDPGRRCEMLLNQLGMAYRKGIMIGVIPFTSKILESCKNSLAYQPPNLWTLAILGLLAEIHALKNLKANLNFESRYKIVTSFASGNIQSLEIFKPSAALVHDYSTELDDDYILSASCMMVSRLAGELSYVTCKTIVNFINPICIRMNIKINGRCDWAYESTLWVWAQESPLAIFAEMRAWKRIKLANEIKIVVGQTKFLKYLYISAANPILFSLNPCYPTTENPSEIQHPFFINIVIQSRLSSIEMQCMLSS
ncbi:CCR4-NOT transcription complex subunit 1 [Artemisia annua]|uniref:CCR4-NOT transcription complex subunit 1 n=1 Tax=Artemisia annua TaxID=35608 RepID=A0A2U1NB23_ARTAN|nr:CCR4-NOT transcription complex subunit 1 [Artemisia annua]